MKAADKIASLEAELNTQRDINALLRHELDLQKARADHWRDAADWVYQKSREACFTMPGSKEGRIKRDNIIGEINKKIGGMTR